jgi:hypothetical protein
MNSSGVTPGAAAKIHQSGAGMQRGNRTCRRSHQQQSGLAAAVLLSDITMPKPADQSPNGIGSQL